MNTTRIAVLHTSPATVELFARLLAEQVPQARVHNMLDDSILPELNANGGDIEAVAPRWRQYARIARDGGAALILNACSSIGELCARAELELGIPVVRVDAALAAEAVRRGRRIAVAATLWSTLAPSTRLLQSTAAAAGRVVDVQACLAEGAYAALMEGRREEHDSLVARTLAQAAEQADVVVLAQASMARVLPVLSAAQQAKCLVSPPLAVRSVAHLLSQRPPAAR